MAGSYHTELSDDDYIDPTFAKVKAELWIEYWKRTPGGKRTLRRIHKERIKSSNLAMQALLQRSPVNQPIDVQKLVDESLAIGKAMVAGFATEKLI